MQQRSVIILAMVGVMLLLAGLVFVWRQGASRSTDTDRLTSSVATVDQGASSPVNAADDLEKLVGEIEATARGDEHALETEYAAENERLMEGTTALEQLGTSYDETNY